MDLSLRRGQDLATGIVEAVVEGALEGGVAHIEVARRRVGTKDDMVLACVEVDRLRRDVATWA